MRVGCPGQVVPFHLAALLPPRLETWSGIPSQPGSRGRLARRPPDSQRDHPPRHTFSACVVLNGGTRNGATGHLPSGCAYRSVLVSLDCSVCLILRLDEAVGTAICGTATKTTRCIMPLPFYARNSANHGVTQTTTRCRDVTPFSALPGSILHNKIARMLRLLSSLKEVTKIEPSASATATVARTGHILRNLAGQVHRRHGLEPDAPGTTQS